MENSEKKTQDRHNELKARLAEAEGECLRVQGLFKQRDHEVAEVKKVRETGKKIAGIDKHGLNGTHS